MTKHIELKKQQDTIDLAAYIAPLLKPGDILCLYGNLGAGKTFFAKALGRFLGVPDDLDSPSFVMLKEYHCGSFPVYHLDLYRLRKEEELLDLGIFDMIESGITLIEWPERAASLIPPHVLELHFSFDGVHRCVDVLANSRFADYFL